MKKELYKLTEEHEKELKPWADKWIKNGLRTRLMDDEDKIAIKKAIRGLYMAADKTPPLDERIVIVKSPFVARFAAGFAAAIWYNRKNKPITASAIDSATHSATENKTFKFNSEGMFKLSLEFNIGQFGLMCAERAYNMWQGGNFWSSWTSFLSFFRHVVKLDIDYSKFEHWEKATIHGSIRYMHEEFCIVSDFPTKILQDDQHRGHCFDGPYIEWADGSGIEL